MRQLGGGGFSSYLGNGSEADIDAGRHPKGEQSESNLIGGNPSEKSAEVIVVAAEPGAERSPY